MLNYAVLASKYLKSMFIENIIYVYIAFLY